MRFYKKITIWENARRINHLVKFRSLIIKYFESVEWSDYGGPIETDDSSKIRSEINIDTYETKKIMMSCGIRSSMYYTPPPAIGGPMGDIDLLTNVFNLHTFRIDPKYLVDHIEQCIGILEKDKVNSLMRTFNPLYWLGLILDEIVSIPFRLLGKAGFNQEGIENSFLGRIVKTFLYLITVFAAFLTVLEKLGYLQGFLIFIQGGN